VRGSVVAKPRAQLAWHLLSLDICHSLYAEADALGEKDLDIVAVVRAIEQRAAALVVETA
jgi:hypothetical protein